MSVFELHLIDIQPSCVDALRAEFAHAGPTVWVSDSDVTTLPRENVAFVSPANCIGAMDGGIDAVYSREMFPGIENTVMNAIKRAKSKTALGRHYLPIGSAVVVPACPSTGTVLVVAPVMFLPSGVRSTRNAYHGMRAALCAMFKYRQSHSNIRTMVCPTLCTGVGMMAPSVAAKQMKEAYDDFVAGKWPEQIGSSNICDQFLTLPLANHEQPGSFTNREIREI